MGFFRIYQDDYADFTVVSNYFIDNYMAGANDAQLKIYLYLIRMLGADLATGVSDIADKFNYTEKDVTRALNYWARQGILKLDLNPSGEITGVRMLTLRSEDASDYGAARETEESSAFVPGDRIAGAQETGPDAAPIIDIRDYNKPQYTKDDLTAFESRPGSSQIIFVAEQYFKRPLNQADITTLLYLSDRLHFSEDLIDYLVQYCADRHKDSPRYIEKVALDWAESGITTPAQASMHVSRYDCAYDVMKALGKNSTSPSTIELEYIDRWRNIYKYDMDVISEACARTVLSTDKNRFKYADSILTGWYKQGIRERSDIDRLDPPRKGENRQTDKGAGAGTNKFNQFTQNTYDYAELEKKLISN